MAETTTDRPASAASASATSPGSGLAARAVAYVDPASGGSSGVYLAGLFARLGVADRIGPKAVLVPGGLVATRVVTGEADLALHQVSEILAVDGGQTFRH